jgi:hypothetical protein
LIDEFLPAAMLAAGFGAVKRLISLPVIKRPHAAEPASFARRGHERFSSAPRKFLVRRGMSASEQSLR